MNLATWSIRNPIPAILLFMMLTVAGLWGFSQLSVESMPDMEFPMIKVGLYQPGAAPAQLETEVARKVEDSAASLPGLRHQTTTVTDGAVNIVLEFELGKPLSSALIETREAIDRIRSELPESLEEPTISALTISGFTMMTFAVSSSRMDEGELSWYIDDRVARKVLTVPGVGSFKRVGGLSREIRVEVNPTQLNGLGITAAQVSRGLRTVQQQLSGGRGQLGETEQSVRTIATVEQASDLRALPIVLGDGQALRLDQIATIEDGFAERHEMALLDGEPVVGFQIFRSKGHDEVTTAAQVHEVLAELASTDDSLKFHLISSTADHTKEQFDGSMLMLYEGALLAVLVVWFFLRDWRATLVAASALPLSVIPTFAAMHWLGFSLNTITLLSLALIVGILVDDAIVEIENIVRHARMGKPIKKAAADAVTEIALAVIATTLALVVVFLPTAFMDGVAGMLFQQFGWTATIAILFSLLVARLLTPMMAAYLLKDHGPVQVQGAGPVQHTEEDGRIMRWYLNAVRWCLGHRALTVIGAGLFLVASVSLVPLLSVGMVPQGDEGLTMINVELPPGTAVGTTLATAEKVRKAVEDVPGIEGIFTLVGNAQGGMSPNASHAGGEVRVASLKVILAPRDERESQAAIEQQIRERLKSVPGARFTVSGHGAGDKFSIILTSENLPLLKSMARTFEGQLRGVEGMSNIASTASLERPEIIIRPNLQRAAEQGVTTAAIGETVRIATSGDFGIQLARLNLDNRQVDIRVRLADVDRADINTFASLRVPGRDGLVPLSSISDLSIESGPTEIGRYDRQRFVTISADLNGITLGDARTAAFNLPVLKDRPDTVHILEDGMVEMMNETFRGFGIAIVTGVFCVFCVLVLLFKDFFQPVTILSALPLSMGGAFVALLVTGGGLNLPSLIGLIMLMGIVSKNSILLVEYTILGMRDHGLGEYEALIDACHKRARPIVMTTVAMIAGMLPLALGFGGDASFRQPMAIAVIGGLLTSTALSLLVVPAVFTYVSALRQRAGRLRKGLSVPGRIESQPVRDGLG